nr:MAG TPA: hypothetical protein [Bacteriophage sp.]
MFTILFQVLLFWSQRFRNFFNNFHSRNNLKMLLFIHFI